MLINSFLPVFTKNISKWFAKSNTHANREENIIAEIEYWAAAKSSRQLAGDNVELKRQRMKSYQQK